MSNKRGKQLNKYVPDYVLYDLETTGISANYDEVIEISAVKVRGGKIIDEFSTLVNPGRTIPYGASAVNHIYDEMVADAPEFEEVLPLFLAFIGNDILVGHNIASFDMKFLYRDFEKYMGVVLPNDFVDTLRLAKIVFPDWKHRRLGDLANYYGISTVGAHRALTDCKMNQKVFELLGKELSGEGTADARQNVKTCPKCGWLKEKESSASSGGARDSRIAGIRRTSKGKQQVAFIVSGCLLR